MEEKRGTESKHWRAETKKTRVELFCEKGAYAKRSFLPPMAFKCAIESARKVAAEHTAGTTTGGIVNGGNDGTLKASSGRGGERDHTSVNCTEGRDSPHEHEEEAGRGHQSSSAGRGQHAQHGHDCNQGETHVDV